MAAPRNKLDAIMGSRAARRDAKKLKPEDQKMSGTRKTVLIITGILGVLLLLVVLGGAALLPTKGRISPPLAA